MVGRLVEFCDRHRIKVDQYLDDRQWPKLREALPALRRKLAAQDTKGVKALLADVKRLPIREAVRAKYRRSRPRLGRGITLKTKGGQFVMVAVLNNGWDEEDFTSRLGHALDLDAATNGLAHEAAGVLASALMEILRDK
jgi:hypothetical protein